jgi:hypothetical protein
LKPVSSSRLVVRFGVDNQEIAMAEKLDHKLDCKKCGTIYLDIPDDLADDAPVACSTCGVHLGLWRDLKADYRRQASQTEGVFDLHDGQIEVKNTGTR